MDTWRFLIDPPQSAAINMATDEAIAIAFSGGKAQSTLRFYQWSEASFSIGSFQKVEAAWIKPLAREAEHNPFTLVRRMTGGRGILHDRDFTYSLISGNKNPLFSSGIKGSYFAIARGLLPGLKILGVDAEIYSPPKKKYRAGMRHPLCFAATSRYEITSGGRKLIGSAQRRWPNHFLQHGSLVLEKSSLEKGSLEKSAVEGSPRVMKQPEWLGIPLVSADQVSLSDLLPQLPSRASLTQAMKAGFESALSIHLEAGSLSVYEQTLVEKLVQEKYGRTAWNLRREKTESVP